MDPHIADALPTIITGGAAVGISTVIGWVATTWMRIRAGYPLETSWGKPLHPIVSTEQGQRVTLLTQENAALRAELGAVKDRLATIERIVTDDGLKLGAEIDRLRDRAN